MSSSSEETISQIALFIQETAVRPPPPHAPSSSLSRTPSLAPRSMILPMQNLPPPPPPPPPIVPSTSSSQLHQVYHGHSPQPSPSFAIGHPPPPIAMFDARRPPPPLHTHIQQNILKRPPSSSCAATPSKSRKTEEPKPEDVLCDVCVQRDISIESYKMKLKKINSDDECQTLLFKKKMNEYNKLKEVLSSLVDRDMFRKVEALLEDVPQNNFRSVLHNFNDTLLTGLTSSNPNQMLLKFMEYLFSQSKYEASPSVRVEDSLRHTLSSMSRSPANRSSPDLLQTLQDILYNEDRSSSSERPEFSETSVERSQTPGTSGISNYRQYSNGQRVEPRTLPPPASLPPFAPAPPPPAPVVHPAPPPTVTYSHYPPPRTHYPPPYLTAPRATTTRAPPHTERYPPPYYYYN